jgi:RNA polymerase sigma-70 factor, ECF subfamily
MHLGAGEGVMRTAASEAASHWRRRPHGLAFVDPDVHLVEALRQRAPGSVEALVATHAKRIYRLAIRIAGNRQDAEEIVQDSLLAAARKIDCFAGRSVFRAWLHRITRNAAVLKLRGRRSRQVETSWGDLRAVCDEVSRQSQPIADWSAESSDAALQTELRAVLTSAIEELPAAYRTTFLCRVVSGQSNSEIAEGLSITIPAVKSRLYRSRRFLQTRMSEYMSEMVV